MQAIFSPANWSSKNEYVNLITPQRNGIQIISEESDSLVFWLTIFFHNFSLILSQPFAVFQCGCTIIRGYAVAGFVRMAAEIKPLQHIKINFYKTKMELESDLKSV